MSSVPRLRSAVWVVLLALTAGALALRAVGKLLHHPGAALAADVVVVFGLLIPAPAIAQLSTRLRAGVIARSPLALLSAITLGIGWTLVSVHA